MDHISEINWHITPFREQRWLDLWEPAVAKSKEYGAESWQIYRSVDDPLIFRQISVWKSKEDFERYWYSEELSAYRAQIVDLYVKPLLPQSGTPIANG